MCFVNLKCDDGALASVGKLKLTIVNGEVAAAAAVYVGTSFMSVGCCRGDLRLRLTKKYSFGAHIGIGSSLLSGKAFCLIIFYRCYPGCGHLKAYSVLSKICFIFANTVVA